MGCKYISILIYILLTIFIEIEGEICPNDLIGNKTCIFKCCPEQYYVSYNICVRNNVKVIIPDFPELDIFDYDLMKVNKTVKDLFWIVNGNMHNQTVEQDIFNTYLIEDGSLAIEVALPNTYQRVTNVRNGMFCVDYTISENETVPELRFWYTNEEKNIEDVTFEISALTVSFILLTLTLVFMLIKEIRSVFERILLSMISSVLAAYGIVLLQLIVTSSESNFSAEFCLSFTFFIYFFILSSFCWMIVIGFHLWSQLRCEMKLVTDSARTMFYYCCFSWGIPLTMGIALIAINQSDLSYVPWFIKPNIPLYGCFISGYERFFYLYVPILILLICNLVVLLISAYKYRERQPMTEIYGGKMCQWFRTYLQLSLVMSLTWILEMISFKNEDIVVWYIVESCYVILCAAIFIILCCNRRTITSLTNRLSASRNKDSTNRVCNKELYPLTRQA